MQSRGIISSIFSCFMPVVFAGNINYSQMCGQDNEVLCDGTGWRFGAKALYLQVKYANEPWLTGQSFINNITDLQSPPIVLQGFGWGGFLEASYHFAGDKAVNGNLYYLYRPSQLVQNMTRDNVRYFKQNTQWIAANVEVSQVIPVSDSNGIRGYIGFQYTNIVKNQSFGSTIYPPLDNLASELSAINNATFFGAGPRMGVDLTYHLPCQWVSGLSVYTNSAFEVLIGESQSRSYVKTSPVDILQNYGVWQSTLSVVPALDVRAGATYQYAMKQGRLTIDVGAMWIEYVSPVVERVVVETADITIQGVYGGLKWVGHLA